MIRQAYVELVSLAIPRLQTIIERRKCEDQIRAGVDPNAIAGVLLAVVIGAQTMMELRVPVDAAAWATELLKMLSPPTNERSAVDREE